MKNLGLYIHIPFCEKKCYYCDFTSFPEKDDKIHKYIHYLIKELSLYKEKIKDYNISSIFIGGGTPSSIDADYIKTVLEYIYENFNLNLKEVSIEVNPGSLTLEKAKLYKEIGINRVSIGVQSLNDELLKSIGRIHKVEDFYNSYEILRSVGFDNINVDIMFGLPGQNLEDVLSTLEKVIELDVDHISFYSLILEPGTLLNKWYEEGKLIMPSEDEDREMYHKGIELLTRNDYNHYEISNFSKEGKKCLQNMIYWKVEPYLGVGINSHSNLNHKRFYNVEDFKNYYYKLDRDSLPLGGEEEISKEMEIGEVMILGLRLIEGIDKNDFKNRFKIDVTDIYKDEISKHKKDGLLTEDEEKIRLSKKGLDLSNLVEVDFLP